MIDEEIIIVGFVMTIVGIIALTFSWCSYLDTLDKRNFAEKGYVQVQNIGASGYHWEKQEVCICK